MDEKKQNSVEQTEVPSKNQETVETPKEAKVDAKAFTEAVALKPVKPTTSAATTSPKAEVTLKPVNGSTALSTVPHPFSPQFKVPQPGFVSTSKLPILVVADKPVN